jgi:uncharacterized glyoxalase superfamily protein PhnB
MKPTPPGWPRISVALFYTEPKKAIDWLVRAFDFEVRLKVEGDDGSIVHSELTYGEGIIMVAASGGNKAHPEAGNRDTSYQKSPAAIDGANTQSMMVYVDDVEAHYVRAKEAGAKIVTEPKTSDYGEEYWSDRGYEAVDLDGHHWWFMQRLRSAKSK